MSNVIIDREKIDILANAISDKSGVPVTMTLAEMVAAVDGIETGGGTPALETITATYTPSTSTITDTLTPSSGYDGIEEVDVTVNAIPIAAVGDDGYNYEFYTENNVRKFRERFWREYGTGGYVGPFSDHESVFEYWNTCNAVQSGTTITPSTSSQSVGGYKYMMEGAVTVNAMPSGSEGTPTATKSAVNNHALTVTPSVTNSAGYISGGTHSGTAVTVSASELVSGSDTITTNDTYDVTNLAEVVVNVSGGGGSIAVGRATTTLGAAANSIQFTGLSGNPSTFAVTANANVNTNTNGVTAVVYDGSAFHGQIATTQAEAETGFSKTYSNGTLTITATSATFQAIEYKLVYSYGGSSADIGTEDIQVGSGATSIAFPVSGTPVYWSCIFKSDFGTSSGYQRVIEVVNDGQSIYGMAFDSSAKSQTSWTAVYSGGTLTISSQGTNNGGYFHQPGYYQLIYAIDDSAPQYQTKTVTPTTATQTVTASAGYDALSQVTVNPIPSEYIIPSGNLPITANADNINVAQYATVSVNVPSGGSSKNAQTIQSTTRTTSTSYTKLCGDLTVTKTGTYDVYWTAFRSSTSGTWGTQLYIGSTAYGTAQSTFSNHCQIVHLSNVSLTANQKISVYGRSRGSNYYAYVGQLSIIEA